MTDIVILYEGPIVSAREAFDRGEKRYFTAKPCKRGHVAQRMVANGVCHECLLNGIRSRHKANHERTKKWRKEHPGARTEEARRYRKKHPETGRKSAMKYLEKNRERLKPINAERARIRRSLRPEAQKGIQERAKAKREANLVEMAGRPRQSKCDICREDCRAVFDHCHQSGKFRGWLCDRCNRTLGQVKDDPRILRRMIDYLRKHDVKDHSEGEECSPLERIWASKGTEVPAGHT